ncbi:Fungal specific transcription factor domain-containing protein [Cladophialophora immunda]|nr:Fungal specific transcription factor domain-containing protein [Cladophialophora immunda]
MKAKACIRCRQWKVGCDADVAGPEGCTRCRSVNAKCVFGANFRRTPKRRMLAELQDEVARLRALTSVLTTEGPVGESPTTSLETNASSWGPENASTAIVPIPAIQQPIIPGSNLYYRGNSHVQLTATQANELFRIYFTRCHPYLPFQMCRSVETVYGRCPLLFWVICAVASTDKARPQFADIVRCQVASVLDPSNASVEVVQALLILSMWPFPFKSQRSDPSFMYGALACQIALQIGLPRPAVTCPGSASSDATNEDQEARLTTWIGCFVVNQILASRLGVPATIFADYALLSSLDDPSVSPQLSHLCSISHLTVESAHAIGARAVNVSGLADPIPRISLINIFAQQFDELRRTRFPDPSDIEEIFFLSSMLQLWSFALHNDVPISPDTFYIVQRARQDAIRLIQVACEKNLCLVPFYTYRSVCFAALLLYHIKLSPYGVNDELLDDHIARAQQTLQSRTGPDLAQFLKTLTSPENRDEFIARRDKNSSHRWKMGAALTFDSAHAYANLTQSEALFFPELLDLDGFLFENPTTMLE